MSEQPFSKDTRTFWERGSKQFGEHGDGTPPIDCSKFIDDFNFEPDDEAGLYAAGGELSLSSTQNLNESPPPCAMFFDSFEATTHTKEEVTQRYCDALEGKTIDKVDVNFDPQTGIIRGVLIHLSDGSRFNADDLGFGYCGLMPEVVK
jgi:hypothetical protein